MDLSPKMLYLKFFFGLSLYIVIIHGGFIQDKLSDRRVLHVDRLTGVCRGQKVPCQGFFQGITTKSIKVLIRNFTFVVKEGGFKKLMITITINRCRSKENLDTCEEYLKQPRMDYCKIIDPNNFLMGRTSIAIPVQPPLKCPLSKGTYHAYNVTYDLTPFVFFKLEGWYWKTTLEVFTPEQNQLIYCVYAEGYVTNSKS